MPSIYYAALQKGNSGADPTAFEVDGLQALTQISSPLVGLGLEETGFDANNRLHNTMAVSGDRLMWWIKDEIRQLDTASNSFTIAHTISDLAIGIEQGGHSGWEFWQDISTGEFGLIGFYRTTGGDLGATKYEYTADTFTNFDSVTLLVPTDATQNIVNFRQTAYHFRISGASVYAFDIIAETFSSIAVSPDIENCGVWQIADNALYVASAGLGPLHVRQLSGASFSLVASVGGLANDGTFRTASRLIFYTADNALYVGGLASGLSFWRLFSVDLTTFAVTEVTTEILPSFLRTADATGTDERRWQFYVTIDQETKVGSPQIYIQWMALTDGANGGTNIFRHTGPNSPWENVGVSALTTALSQPDWRHGGSIGLVNSLAQAIITQKEPKNQAMDVTFRGFGPNTPTLDVLFRHNAGENPANTPSTISTPDGGLIGGTAIASKVLQNVVFDGTTEYKFRHELAVDNIELGSFFSYWLEAQ